MSSQEISEEDRQTLFVAGISKDVDEEILYELFLNVRHFLGVFHSPFLKF